MKSFAVAPCTPPCLPPTPGLLACSLPPARLCRWRPERPEANILAPNPQKTLDLNRRLMLSWRGVSPVQSPLDRHRSTRSQVASMATALTSPPRLAPLQCAIIGQYDRPGTPTTWQPSPARIATPTHAVLEAKVKALLSNPLDVRQWRRITEPPWASAHPLQCSKPTL